VNGVSQGDCDAAVTLAVRHARPSGRPDGDPLLAVVGDIELSVDAERVVALPGLPIVELAQQLDRWLVAIGPEEPDFVYTSLAAMDEPGLLYYHHSDPCWRAGSIAIPEEREAEASLRELAAASSRYVADVGSLVEPLGIDLPRVLRQLAR
jgi:hypothetical protein